MATASAASRDRPLVDVCIGAQGLHGGEREAAGEHAQTAVDRLFVDGQQRVAPVQRCAQGLVARQRQARAAGQQAQAVAEPGPQAMQHGQVSRRWCIRARRARAEQPSRAF